MRTAQQNLDAAIATYEAYADMFGLSSRHKEIEGEELFIIGEGDGSLWISRNRVGVSIWGDRHEVEQKQEDSKIAPSKQAQNKLVLRNEALVPLFLDMVFNRFRKITGSYEWEQVAETAQKLDVISYGWRKDKVWTEGAVSSYVYNAVNKLGPNGSTELAKVVRAFFRAPGVVLPHCTADYKFEAKVKNFKASKGIRVWERKDVIGLIHEWLEFKNSWDLITTKDIYSITDVAVLLNECSIRSKGSAISSEDKLWTEANLATLLVGGGSSREKFNYKHNLYLEQDNGDNIVGLLRIRKHFSDQKKAETVVTLPTEEVEQETTTSEQTSITYAKDIEEQEEITRANDDSAALQKKAAAYQALQLEIDKAVARTTQEMMKKQTVAVELAVMNTKNELLQTQRDLDHVEKQRDKKDVEIAKLKSNNETLQQRQDKLAKDLHDVELRSKELEDSAIGEAQVKVPKGWSIKDERRTQSGKRKMAIFSNDANKAITVFSSTKDDADNMAFTIGLLNSEG